MATRFSVDIGGTFTDLLCYDDRTGELLVGKVPTTPDNPEQGAIRAIMETVPENLIRNSQYFLHGTTVGLNALLERRGAVVGLLTTEGFRDVLELRRGSRDDIYNAFWTPPPPLVPRRLRLPVAQRVNAKGDVLKQVNADDVRSALKIFREEGVTAIAVAFLHAYANPAHELEVEKILREAGFEDAISLSHRVSGEYRDYERTSTTVVDAFVRARLSNYLNLIETELKGHDFSGSCLITRSGSGSMSFAEAQDRPFETIMSGPVAGAEGAAELSRTLGLGDLVTADVGGTSFDTAFIRDGRPQLLYQGEVDGMPLQTPWVDVRSIGSGGGSIAHVDAGGLLQVGPRSAGADPGPACYCRGGTEPTTTDAAFYLGMLGDGKLASSVNLDRNLSAQALKTLADKLDYTEEQTAQGIVAIASAAMAGAIREITVEQGIDPRGLKMLAFGGAGPMLATELARELAIDEIIVPMHAGNFSAWGLLGADLLRSAARTRVMALDEDNLQQAGKIFEELLEGLHKRGDQLQNDEQYIVEYGLDIRYQGQEYPLTVQLNVDENSHITDTKADVLKSFEDIYRSAYGELLEGDTEIVSMRASIRQPLPARKNSLFTEEARDFSSDDYTHEAYSFARGKFVKFAYIERRSLAVGKKISGPAIIFEPTTTTYVDADFNIELDASGCMHLIRQEG